MVMERTAGETGALGEAVVFLDYFKDLPDPRQRGKVLYPLDEVLLLCLLAVLAGSEAITDIARFGEKKLELLRRFRPFRDGTLSHDHLGCNSSSFASHILRLAGSACRKHDPPSPVDKTEHF